MVQRLFWPSQIQEAMHEHVSRAVSRLDPDRFAQEPAYVAALMARLDGVVYDGHLGHVEIIATVIADRGSGSAESLWGADFAITASLSQGDQKARKAALGQAKLGSTEELPESQRSYLTNQCAKMQKATRAVLVLEVPEKFGDLPLIPLAEKNANLPDKALSLDEYLVDHVMTCAHGDTRGRFVQSV